MIQDCYIEEIKDIVKEKKLHMSNKNYILLKEKCKRTL